MSIYTKFQNGLGYTNFRRDGKIVKTADVPSNVVDLLEHQPEVDDANLKLESPYRTCLFCKKYTKLSRMVNQQTIYLCKEHYYDKTIGQIAQEFNTQKQQGVAV